MTETKGEAAHPQEAPKEEVAGLSEWRTKHLGELDANLAVARAIRDDPDASARDRNEAVKAIARMMGIMGNEKPRPASDTKKRQEWPKLTPAEHAALERLLNG